MKYGEQEHPRDDPHQCQSIRAYMVAVQDDFGYGKISTIYKCYNGEVGVGFDVWRQCKMVYW